MLLLSHDPSFSCEIIKLNANVLIYWEMHFIYLTTSFFDYKSDESALSIWTLLEVQSFSRNYFTWEGCTTWTCQHMYDIWRHNVPVQVMLTRMNDPVQASLHRLQDRDYKWKTEAQSYMLCTANWWNTEGRLFAKTGWILGCRFIFFIYSRLFPFYGKVHGLNVTTGISCQPLYRA
jgi:hypothetical protein